MTPAGLFFVPAQRRLGVRLPDPLAAPVPRKPYPSPRPPQTANFAGRTKYTVYLGLLWDPVYLGYGLCHPVYHWLCWVIWLDQQDQDLGPSNFELSGILPVRQGAGGTTLSLLFPASSPAEGGSLDNRVLGAAFYWLQIEKAA